MQALLIFWIVLKICIIVVSLLRPINNFFTWRITFQYIFLVATNSFAVVKNNIKILSNNITNFMSIYVSRSEIQRVREKKTMGVKIQQEKQTVGTH